MDLQLLAFIFLFILGCWSLSLLSYGLYKLMNDG